MTEVKHDHDRKLNKSLEDTFPASDPNSRNETEKEPVRPIDRKPCADRSYDCQKII